MSKLGRCDMLRFNTLNYFSVVVRGQSKDKKGAMIPEKCLKRVCNDGDRHVCRCVQMYTIYCHLPFSLGKVGHCSRHPTALGHPQTPQQTAKRSPRYAELQGRRRGSWMNYNGQEKDDRTIWVNQHSPDFYTLELLIVWTTRVRS